MEHIAFLLAISLLFLAGFVLPTWRIACSTGINPYVLPHGDNPEGYVARLFRITMLTLGAYGIAAALAGGLGPWLPALPLLDYALVRAVGWAGLVPAMALILLAQWQMGGAWRIGIDRNQHTELVMDGVFGYSRNPIFLGMRLGLFSAFLLNPDIVMTMIVVAGELAMQMQVRFEEDFLRAKHGKAYETYSNATPRWL